MSRKPPRPPATEAARLHGLAQLEGLRRRLISSREASAREVEPVAARAGKPPGPAPASGGSTKGTTPPEADDSRLFHASVRDAIPIKHDNRADVAPPKPAPLPRPRTPDTGPDDTPPRRRAGAPLDDHALFHSLMADVVPLRERGHADVDATRSPPRLPDAHRAHPGDATHYLLHPDADSVGDDELFRYATRGARPLPQDNRAENTSPPPPPEPLKRSEDELAALRESMEAPMSFEDRLDMGEEAAFLRIGLPRRVLVDLRRGRWVLQGEIDLHGLNREEARTALARFLGASLQRGRRCVRVIHGKGLGSPGRESILKQLSRGWLAQREEILAFCQAQGHQGGSGALLVLLRAPSAGNPQAGREER
ncbi:MAG: Smr/MutS family protein [Rhodocyclaceae bacterium]